MGVSTTYEAPARRPGLLDRARIVARPGFNRWLVPPAALAIHPGPASPATLAVGDAGVGIDHFSPVVLLAWAAVGLPLAWGVWITLSKASALFG